MRRRLLLQQLDSRELLAADMGAIGGIAFVDVTGNGLSADDTRLENVQIQLFLDDGDGQSNAGDTLQATVNTGTGAIANGRITGVGSGEYRFDGLAAGTYHVLQASSPGALNPTPITVTVTNTTGDAAATRTIDSFSQTPLSVTADSVTTTNSGSVATPVSEAIGGERNVVVNNTNSLGQVTVFVDSASDQLSIGSLGDATGTAVIQYDGTDGSTTLNPTGLGGVSLAGDSAGANLDPGAGLIIRTRAENPGDNLVVTLFTDGSNSSSATVPLPVNAADFEEICILFSDFVTATGTGADFNNIGAIEMSVSLSANNDVFAEIIEARTPLITDATLANPSLLTLGGVLWQDSGAGANFNNGVLDAGEATFGAGIQVDLYRRDSSDGSLDPATDTSVATTTTAANGTYSFANLEPDDYLVVVPESQFANGQPLFGFIESTGINPANDPDDNVDSDDNGTLVAGVGLSSGIITLATGTEPTNDDDADPNTNTTLDFGLRQPAADLVITKTDSQDPVNAGNQFTYRITVRNDGPDTATAVVATDNLPDDVSFVSSTFITGGGTVTENPVGSGDLTITLGDLASGEQEVVDITVAVDTDAASPLNNVVSVVATPDNDPDPSNNSTTEPTTVNRVVDVAIDKSVTGTPIAGQNLTYTLVVNNNGPGEARNVTVSDVLDSRLSFVSFDAQSSGVSISQNGQNLSFDVGTLANGASSTFSFIASIASSATGDIPNAAQVSTTDDDQVTSNNQDDVSVNVQNEIDLILQKSVNQSTAVAGQDQLVYTIAIQHDTDSSSDAQNVVVTDTLPAGLSLDQANISAPGATSTAFDSTTRIATITYASLPVSETRTITITANVDEDATGTITNPASVSADGTELDLTNNSDTASTTLNSQFDVTITKAVDDPTVSPGDTVTYTVGITNTGPSTATGVVLSDDVPTGLTFVSGVMNGQQGSLSTDGTAVSFPAVTLADDASQTATLVFTVDAATNGQVTNTASVSADAGETNLNNNSAQAQITVTPITDITVSKSVDRANAQSGQTLVYSVTVTNNGPSIASSVQAIDTLPAGVTFVSGTGPNSEALSVVGGQVTVNGGDLASGASFSFTINATVNAGITADQTNSVVVSTSTNESNPNNNTATAVTNIDPVTSSIAGTVYVDANNNGVQDTGEAGIAGVSITLTGTDDLGNAVNQTATTDANGDYLFANLAAGTYQVSETQPTGFRDGQESAGQNATANVLDDAFTQLGLGEDTDAVEFNFGELNEALSKRRFLASS